MAVRVRGQTHAFSWFLTPGCDNLQLCLHAVVPHFPRTLTAGMELEVVIQDVVAEPCALLLEDSSIFKVYFWVRTKDLSLGIRHCTHVLNIHTLGIRSDSRCGG